MFCLFNMIIAIALNVGAVGLSAALDVGLFMAVPTLYSLAVIIPGIAVSVRRLHDIGKSGWYLLVGFIPLIGVFILLYFMVVDSNPGNNEYGPNPKGA